MTPELKTCLNYCDHGEGTGPDGTGNPYLPTLRGLIVNAVRAERSELEQQVKNLEEYMLKGVAFRDELQASLSASEAEVAKLREAVEWVLESDECYALDYEDMVAELRRRAGGEG